MRQHESILSAIALLMTIAWAGCAATIPKTGTLTSPENSVLIDFTLVGSGTVTRSGFQGTTIVSIATVSGASPGITDMRATCNMAIQCHGPTCFTTPSRLPNSSVPGVLRAVSEQIGPKLDQMIEDFTKKLDAWVVTAGEELHREVLEVLIAGLLARRIVFNKRPGDTLARGERSRLADYASEIL